MIGNNNELEQKKPEDRDKNSLSSGSVPGAVLFSEPFLKDLDLIWHVDISPNHGIDFISWGKYL